MTVSQWAEAKRVLSTDESSIPGRWKNDLTRYLVDPMDAMGHRGVSKVTLMCCSQAGKSECVRNALGYWADLDPGPTIWVMPTEGGVKEAIDVRLKPMLQNSIPWVISGARHSLSHRMLRLNTMTIYPGWSGSPSSLATRPIRYAIYDETDKGAAHVGDEGGTVELIGARLRTFKGRRKMVLLSTPTTRHGIIARHYYGTEDQRDFRLHCPHCEGLMPLSMALVRWPKGAKASQIERERLAWIECPLCHKSVTEEQRLAAIPRGRYVSTLGLDEGSYSSEVAYRFGALVNPWADIHTLAAKWLKCQGNIEALTEFVNQELGEAFEEVNKHEKIEVLTGPNKRYEVPRWASALVAGADSQQASFYFVVAAVGRGNRLHILNYGEVFSEAELVSHTLDSVFELEGRPDVQLAPALLAIDSGGSTMHETGYSHTQAVYDFCSRDPSLRIPIKGRAKWGPETKIIEQRPIDPSKSKTHVPVVLRLLHTQLLKDLLDSVRKQGLFSVYAPTIPDEHRAFNAHMQSEHKVIVREKGIVREMWKPVSSHTPNHFFDAVIYSLAGGMMAAANTLPELGELYGPQHEKQPRSNSTGGAPRGSYAGSANPYAGGPRGDGGPFAGSRDGRVGLGPDGRPFLANRR